MDAFFSAILQLVREFWWVFFIGWWAWCLNRASVVTNPAQQRMWLLVPAMVTLLGLIASLSAMSSAYNGVDWGCSAYHDATCAGQEMAADDHYRGLRGDNPLQTWWNSFGDTVAWLQCIWLFLFFITIPVVIHFHKKAKTT